LSEEALRAAIPAHFRRQAEIATAEANRLRLLGRIFIPIGFAIMCVCMLVSELLTAGNERHVRDSIAEGILVLGWVALWAPFDSCSSGGRPRCATDPSSGGSPTRK
jgi:hypothetical protein